MYLLSTISMLVATLPILQASPVELNVPGKCTNNKTKVHKEWSALTGPERIDFISSVKCLMEKPSKIPREEAPGAISRYDDFIGTHINQTHLIHNNGIFLTWHRQYLYLFQKALREECNFQGTLPYWNWPWWASDLHNSPLFDGSPTSLGGDGYYNASAEPLLNGNYTFPRGTGGGCVDTGPFANTTLHFKNFEGLAVPPNKLEYAPHCLRRDFNNGISRTHNSQEHVDFLLASPDIAAFQSRLSDFIPGTPIMGPHGGGHYAIGKDMQDQFASPSDPAFWLHHAMIDLMYAQWQAKDPHERQYALDGTVTSLNMPPSQNATLDFVLDFGYLGEQKMVFQLMNVDKFDYCYRYEYAEGSSKPENH
ncbi:tyrosinase central domain protein [Corynespora cassiicola Philippines]|uniref:Tyrosinase central domain protein n=1 Tax=Corynespora cassiicola Philippines TaxID=1448308 RepID=A0A2T2NN63_CORCC|nr:tyrosinase central domain protein [Corynespora cassiicola Philippines]